jgi:hypothetical protein
MKGPLLRIVPPGPLGRQLLRLIELQPGSAANPGNAVLGGSAGGNSAFVNGQRNRANNFLLDGTDNNDQFTAGRVAINPNVDVIQEFRVSTNNFSAEFGRNSASAVNVVTKSGTNQQHGTAYEFVRNDRFDTKSVLATQKDPLEFNQFGATNGGAMVQNRLFYFAAYEGLRLTRGTTVVKTVETPEFRQLVAAQFPNSIANFLFQRFPSPPPTSNIRDIGRPVTGLQTENILNAPGVAGNPDYVVTGGGLYRNALQGTADGIPDIGSAAISLAEKTDANPRGGRRARTNAGAEPAVRRRSIQARACTAADRRGRSSGSDAGARRQGPAGRLSRVAQPGRGRVRSGRRRSC